MMRLTMLSMDVVSSLMDVSSLAVLQAFFQSNLAGQSIVILLILFSLIAWTVMIGKHLELRKFREQNEAFQKRLDATEEILKIDPNLP